jgi:hypothetical protein
MSALGVFSGRCLQAVCGKATSFNDINGEPLRTGDIVMIFSVREDDGDPDYFPKGLTAVVSDEFTSYATGEGTRHERNPGPPGYFVMGIKDVPLDGEGNWRVMKVKGFEDVVEGEHWPQYGFSYKTVGEIA